MTILPFFARKIKIKHIKHIKFTIKDKNTFLTRIKVIYLFIFS